MTVQVTCLGHIKTSVGQETLEVEANDMTGAQLIEVLRGMASNDPNAGFTKFNTLIVINGGVAFTASSDSQRIRDGDKVLLVPSSHGG